jgi:hypothetical protein
MGQPLRKMAKSAPPSEPTERWLTRAEAADLLGVSVTTILGHERLGRITARWTIVTNARGQMRDTPVLRIEEILKLPRGNPNPTPENIDELSARAFTLFENGKTAKQAVIELRAAPQKILAIHEEWLDMGGAELVLSAQNKKSLTEIFGEFESTEDLIALAQKNHTKGNK